MAWNMAWLAAHEPADPPGRAPVAGVRACARSFPQLEDAELANTQMRVPGKGNRQRFLPLPAGIMKVLRNCLRPERPLTNAPFLLVSPKGRRRGQAITHAGARSLFRHHRECTRAAAALEGRTVRR
jgi:site-specific recombinase XerD